MVNRKEILLAMQNSNTNKEITVEAFDLSSVFSSLTNAVSTVIDKNDVAGSILQIIADGLIVMYGGIWWGIASAVLNYGFGINVKSIWVALRRVFSYFFKSGKAETLSQSTVDSTADDLSKRTLSLLPIPDDQANRPLADIFEEKPEILSNATYHQDGQIVKVAFGLGTILGWIGKLTTKGFFGDLLKNTIKAILVAIVTVMGVKKGKEILQPTKPGEGATGALPTNTSVPPTLPGKEMDILHYLGQPSGKGETVYANDADENGDGERMWMLPNNVGDFNQFMFSWFQIIYHNCPANLQGIIEKYFSLAAKRIKQAFEKFNPDTDINQQGAYIRVPNNFTNIKQIIDNILYSISVAKK